MDSQYNARGQLSSSQLQFLRRRGIVQILIFAFLLVILCPMGVYGVWLFATEPRPQEVPVLAVAFMILFFAALGLMGLSFGWLALAMIPYLANLSKVRVESFDDAPNKDTFRLRPAVRPFGYRTFTMYLRGQVVGVWLNHAGRAYAVDLSLFEKIPDKGFFHFYYIRRPYLPLILSPYEVINFEPLSTEGGREVCKLAFWVLVDCLDSEPYWARSAAEELAKLGDKRAVEPLLARLNRQEASVRATIAQALGTLKDSRAIQPLVEALKEALKDDDDEVAEATAHALGQLGDEEAVESLIEALDSIWDYVQEAAIAAFGKIGGDKAVDLLLKKLEPLGEEDLEDLEERDLITRVLGTIGGQRVVSSLLARLESREGWKRADAAHGLGYTRDIRAVESLIRALRDEEDSVRWSAAESLGLIGDKRAIGSLVKALQDTNSVVRFLSAQALGDLQASEAVGPLAELLKDEDFDVKWHVCLALGKIGDRRAMGPLIEALKDESVCSFAAQALASFKDPQSIEPLAANYWSCASGVRRAVCGAMGEMGERRAVEFLISALEDSDDYPRAGAAEALGKLGDERAVEPLIDLLGKPGLLSGSRAADALGQISGEKAIRLLSIKLKKGNDQEREMAARALGATKDRGAVELLLQALGDENSGVRSTAIEALANIGDTKVIEPLLSILTTPGDCAVNTAALALGRLKEERVVKPLISILATPSEGWDHYDALKALELILGDRALETIISQLKDADWLKRREAAIALGVIRDESAIEPLAAALSDEEWFVCLGAAQALVKIGGDKVVDLLVPAVGDNNYETRLAAIQSLKILALRDSQKYAYTAGTFLERLDDEEWKVRDVAVKALGQLGYGPAAAKLKQIAESDSQEDVRKAAQAALAKIKQKV